MAHQLLKENTEEKWNEIRKHEFYKILILEVQTEADKWLEKPTEVLKFSDFNRYFTDGNRVIYEERYFERRGKLNAFTLMYKLTGEAKYKMALEDIICAICDEFTWALPAHVQKMENAENFEESENTAKSDYTDKLIQAQHERHCWLDLFAAETGFALSEIWHLLGDQLTPDVSTRIQYEVKTRIIDSFLNVFPDNGWEHSESNWAAVCAGGIGHCFLYLASEDEIRAALPRLIASMKCFLTSFPKDGVCLEGYGYWTYGFGFFLEFAQSLREYSEGSIDLLKSDHVNAIAHFQQAILLGENRCLTFSDGPGEEFQYELGITHFLYENFDGIVVPKLEYRSEFGKDNCYRFGTFLRNFLWSNPKITGVEAKNGSHYFKEAQWYLKNDASYAFAGKAGHNGEPHNHNDIGHFVMVKGNRYLLHDLGAGEYVAAYFKDQTRYDFLVNSSRGHSVPIINGQYQIYGKEHAGEMLTANKNEFFLSMEKAYGVRCLSLLTRKFSFSGTELTLIDNYVFRELPTSVTERFITLVQPELAQDKVIIKEQLPTKTEREAVSVSLMLCYDHENWNCTVTQEQFKGHKAEDKVAYLIDFTAVNLAETMEFKLVMK